ILLRVLGLQEEELRADQRTDHIIDRPGNEDDPLLQQARIDIVGTLATVGLLDHHGYERVHVDVQRIAHWQTSLRHTWGPPWSGTPGGASSSTPFNGATGPTAASLPRVRPESSMQIVRRKGRRLKRPSLQKWTLPLRWPLHLPMQRRSWQSLPAWNQWLPEPP